MLSDPSLTASFLSKLAYGLEHALEVSYNTPPPSEAGPNPDPGSSAPSYGGRAGVQPGPNRLPMPPQHPLPTEKRDGDLAQPKERRQHVHEVSLVRQGQ